MSAFWHRLRRSANGGRRRDRRFDVDKALPTRGGLEVLLMLPSLLLSLVFIGCSAPKATDADADGWDVSVDCDDGNADIHPNADETCDGLDDDCDGSVDEGAVDATTWYQDGDGDGSGADTGSAVACEAPAGSVATGGDCDDADPAFHPGADESDCADPHDYNCDGSVGYADADGDGSAACVDCNDGDATVNPSAAEVCNGADDDCDSRADDADDSLDVATAGAFYTDADGDGYGAGDAVPACSAPSGTVANADDCDDGSSAVNPGAIETCDGRDDDCDGAVDDADDSLDLATAGAYYADADSDGVGTGDAVRACQQPSETASRAGDCDDEDASVSPGVAETCDGVDDDCDGLADDADPDVAAPTWHLDHDSDGYGGGAYAWASCDAPPGYVADAGDCDDARADVYPSATEVCDPANTDEDCDGLADDADPDVDPSGESPWYVDADSDGFGDPTGVTIACDQPAGRTSDGTDCDDTDPDVYPTATEVCDDRDNDCDGLVDWGHRVPSDYAGVQEAVDAVADGDTICVEAGTYTGAITTENRSVTIQGTYGSAVTTLDGGGEGTAFYLSGDAGTGCALVGLTLTGGNSSLGAGLWINYASVALRDIVISANICTAAGDCQGTGMYAESSTITLDDVDVRGNIATTWLAYGTGAYFYDTDATISRSHFDGNQLIGASYVWGTALAVGGGSVSFTDVTVDDNVVSGGDATVVVGALYVSGATLEAQGLSVSGNRAEGGYVLAAGMYLEEASFDLSNLSLIGNDADAATTYTAGAMLVGSGDLTNLVVAGNRASGAQVVSAGLLLEEGEYRLHNATIAGNAVVATGAESFTYTSGLASDGSSSTLDNVTVTGNTVSSSGTVLTGGVYYDSAEDLLTYVNSWGNDVSDWSTDLAGTGGNLSVDPLYTDITSADPADWDVTLQAGSPLIDAGDPSILDVDGTRSDIGAWGGPGAAGW